jgi:hypothetical protein
MRRAWNFDKIDVSSTPSWAAVEMLQEIRDILSDIRTAIRMLPTCGQLSSHLRSATERAVDKIMDIQPVRRRRNGARRKKAA